MTHGTYDYLSKETLPISTFKTCSALWGWFDAENQTAPCIHIPLRKKTDNKNYFVMGP
jgi:hypothetical protein